MYAAKAPPAAQEFFAIGALKVSAEAFDLAFGFEGALEFVAQRFDQPRHGDEHGDSLASNRGRHIGGPERIEEDRRRAQNLRNENAEHLSENMAERQQIQKFQRMKKSLILAVARDLPLDRLEIREHVPMREHHAARLGCGPRSENNLERVAALQAA